MAVAFRGRNSDFDWQKQCDRSDYFSLDETHDTDEQSYDHNTAARYHNFILNRLKLLQKAATKFEVPTTIPRYILLILVVVAIVTFMVCVTLLMIILLTMMPQNISDAAREGNVFIYGSNDLAQLKDLLDIYKQ